jgi:starch-binding outer membrane protein, SusD/RagB family
MMPTSCADRLVRALTRRGVISGGLISGRLLVGSLLVGGLIVGGLIGCDASQPLKVKDPDVAPPTVATGPNSLPLLTAGTLADVAVAVVGAADQANNAHEGIANFGGIFTDEFDDEDTFPTRIQINNRIAFPQNASTAGVFQNLGAAHNDALRAFVQYKLYAPQSVGLAEMYNIDAYLYIYIAEHFCSGVPFSTINITSGQVVNGPLLTTGEMLDTALAEFANAKGALVGDTADAPALITQQSEFASVGESRALLDLGQVALAADTAALITDPTFAYLIYESNNTPRQENGIWNYTAAAQTQAFSVANSKDSSGIPGVAQGLPFITANDPRVPSQLSSEPASNGDPVFYNQLKYPAGTSPFVVANYTEAQLIVAEGKIFAGNYAGGKAILDGLRGTVGLGPLPDSSAAGPKAEIQQLLTERAFWMYVTGHRLGDWRRVLRPPYSAPPYSFVINDVYAGGTQLSTTLELPTPQTVNPNPNYVPCDATSP